MILQLFISWIFYIEIESLQMEQIQNADNGCAQAIVI